MPKNRAVELVREVAELAKVSEANRKYFCDEILIAIEDAHRVPRARARPLFRSEQLISVLNDVTRDARNLRAALARMNAVGDARNPYEIVGQFLRAELNDRRLKLGICIDLLDKLASAADEGARAFASPTAAIGGRPPTNFALDIFAHTLISAARTNGRSLTIYKSAHSPDGWDGTLWKAMRLLQPILPKEFSSAHTGSSLDRIAKRFRPKTQKVRGRRS
jgi:hypothetical protein